jgi:hypothetical protein
LTAPPAPAPPHRHRLLGWAFYADGTQDTADTLDGIAAKDFDVTVTSPHPAGCCGLTFNFSMKCLL